MPFCGNSFRLVPERKMPDALGEDAPGLGGITTGEFRTWGERKDYFVVGYYC